MRVCSFETPFRPILMSHLGPRPISVEGFFSGMFWPASGPLTNLRIHIKLIPFANWILFEKARGKFECAVCRPNRPEKFARRNVWNDFANNEIAIREHSVDRKSHEKGV